MARVNLLLMLAVIATALFLVHTQYQSRQLYTELDRAQQEARRLELDRDRLQVEKRAQATPLRVEKLAKEQLQMRTTSPAITQYVRPDGSVIPAVAPVAPVVPVTSAARPTAKPVARPATAARSAR
ncbi:MULTISPECIES: cell division protein FtsL [unclassified Variovorax]|jgi:cell division protein FtsL|uniref:cell division protein FtsL n=1 Tax=unclassified Variovorax TaxID=663243 RepID=UPI0008AB5456|nr:MULTISPECIES: cell division protein FtsL [unclassified Variovorax]SEI98345.1 cell division protein FtsL [Variovorax sp. OK202]SFB88874.1 cell division protein FtsL [Variovorax sp. OK212]